MQRGDQPREALGSAGGVRGNPEAAFGGFQLGCELHWERSGIREVARSEGEPERRMPHRPVPVLMDVESPEQALIALEQIPAGVQ